MGTKSSYTVDSTETSLTILETLIESNDPVGVTALAESVEVSKSVVHNHLSTLCNRGYVVHRDDQYEPALETLALGSRTRARLPVYRNGRKQIDALAAATDRTATLFVLEETNIVPVYVAEPTDGWSPEFFEGEPLPLYTNAPGKAIMASLPPEEVTALLDDISLTAVTEATITDREELGLYIENIRDEEIVFSKGEHYDGIVGVAAAIAPSERNPAIAVHGRADRLNGRYLSEDVAGQVLSISNSIRADLT